MGTLMGTTPGRDSRYTLEKRVIDIGVCLHFSVRAFLELDGTVDLSYDGRSDR